MESTVDYIDSLGDDITVVNSARVSFNKESDYAEDGSLLSGDEKLIRFLARHNHWTPFSHVQVTLRETVPIFVARQRFKHMIGFTYNEISRRYVNYKPEFYRPEIWRKVAANKKQGSTDEPVTELRIQGTRTQTVDEGYEKFLQYAEDLYCDMLEAGVCPEQARMVLPQSMMTSYFVTGSLAAWARAYKLRIAPDAQKEIRDLANQWGPIMKEIAPVSWNYLTE